MKIISNGIKKKNFKADNITNKITGKKEENHLIKYTAIKFGEKMSNYRINR